MILNPLSLLSKIVSLINKNIIYYFIKKQRLNFNVFSYAFFILFKIIIKYTPKNNNEIV